jgi:hypothetical protein
LYLAIVPTPSEQLDSKTFGPSVEGSSPALVVLYPHCPLEVKLVEESSVDLVSSSNGKLGGSLILVADPIYMQTLQSFLSPKMGQKIWGRASNTSGEPKSSYDMAATLGKPNLLE